jgi:hypothetical protein
LVLPVLRIHEDVSPAFFSSCLPVVARGSS